MRTNRLFSLAVLVIFSNLLFGQTATTPGVTSTMKVPMVSEPFASNAAATPARLSIIRQPEIEESLQHSPSISAQALLGLQEAMQAQSLTAPGPTLGTVFDVQPHGLPPDSAIAAGPNHLVISVNSVIQIYSKFGNLISSNTWFGFFNSLGTAGSCCFDVRAAYDPNHGRFIIAAAAVDSSTTSHIFIGVSQTSDPTGNWFKFDLLLNPTTPEGSPASIDFPALGVSTSSLYLTANLPPSALKGTESTEVWVLQLAGLLAGNSTLNVTAFPNVHQPNGSRAFTIQPAIMYGDAGVGVLAATSGNPQSVGNAIHLYFVPETGTPTLTAIDIPVATYNEAPPGPQPNTTSQLAIGGDILTSPPVWRNGSLWVAQEVADPTGTVPIVRWYEIVTASNTVRQTGTLTGAGSAFIPSITVTASGATDIVFDTSNSTSQFASPAFAHREASDPLGTMPVQAIYQNGLASYGEIRWGDYTAISADPDGVSSWTLAEYPVDFTDYRLSSAHLLSSAANPPPGCNASTVGVKVCSPASGATVNSPLQISAASLGNASITGMKAYANGVNVATSTSATLSAQVALANATYTLVVKAWDTTGKIYQTTETITVGPGTAPCSTTTVGVKICSPSAGANVTSPVQISAASKGTKPITGMKAYANGVNVATSTNGTLNAKVTLSPGTYTLAVKGWESTGVVHQSTQTLTVH